MKWIEIQHIASTDISIPVSSPALVSGNHPFFLVFHLDKKNEKGASQCNPDGEYFTEAVSLMKFKICI
jgi:hypothetical protein